MIVKRVIIATCSLLFFLVGADKFFGFLEPPCSLMESIPKLIWSFLGCLQIAAGILIWLPRFRKYIVGFFFAFMSFFTIAHIINGTYDIGGSVFMAGLLGLLLWNPDFLGGIKK